VLADIVGFTPLCDGADPAEIGALLDRLYGRFDELCAAHGVEKIKTLGDAWMAASGVPVPRADHEDAAARLALALRDATAASGPPLRIGLHAGPAVAGVIGRARFAYDLWGDAVDGAVAMERASRPGGIRVERRLAERLQVRGFTVDLDEAGGWLVDGPRG
jgi:class 3 adenylate cyclase